MKNTLRDPQGTTGFDRKEKDATLIPGAKHYKVKTMGSFDND